MSSSLRPLPSELEQASISAANGESGAVTQLVLPGLTAGKQQSWPVAGSLWPPGSSTNNSSLPTNEGENKFVGVTGVSTEASRPALVPAPASQSHAA